MESWSRASRGKVLISDEMMPPSNSLGGARSKNGPVSWDLGTPPTSSFGHNMMVSAHGAATSNGLGEMGLQELTVGPCPYGNVVSDGTKSVGPVPVFGALSPFSGVNGSSSNLAFPAISAGCQDSLHIDLKLGRFLPDIMDSHNPRDPQGVLNFSSSGSAVPQKRNRSSGLNSQVAHCQVYGCHKDLSSCKDYHKRHKICEVHSKTPRVIVNGIEQRFCQQCSRFHLLSEFDETKRSCRKRLAGHNERRRKPQVSVQAGRIGRLLQSCGGNMFRANSSRSSSLVCQDIIFSGGLLNSDQSVARNSPGCIKVEDGSMFGPLPTVPFSKGHLDSKPLYSFDRPFNFFHDGVNSTSSSIFADNDQCQRDQGRRNFVSHSLFPEASTGAEDFTIFDTAASTIQALSGISESGCALSLLSSQSQSSSSHSSGIPMGQPLIASSSIASHSSIRGLSNNASLMKPVAMDADSLLISDSVNFEFPDGALQGPDFTNIKDGSTINLLQLSTQLQRVNDQRQFI
ncbi:hypothetical protein MLD38_021801 [Melastoma candidum]|uniref:Uncharacterized protein n=1 Tax=Melastoma candidum TaxID=119954 RepID=A0ACB9QI52_9MYRT|nr:hypothetical protein MLD38_021801 [Melastoma candidum]